MTGRETDVRAVAELTAETVVEALNRAFAGYLVPATFTIEGYERRLRAENLDPFASRVYFRGDVPAGVVLVTRRGWTSRVGAMGVASDARGTGMGRRIMDDVVRDARGRGDRRLVLEVFAQNAPAVRLYESVGFRTVRRLLGWHWTAPAMPPAPSDALDELDPLELGRAVACEGEPGLPWMLAPETLAAATPPARAFRLGGEALALTAPAGGGVVRLVALLVPATKRRQGWGTRMLHALAAHDGAAAVLVPQLVPETLAPGFFAATGWERDPLNQFEMAMDLAADGAPPDSSPHPAPDD
jgi:ribosomal protein S18 acetylase RimI-like enzyme